MKKEVINNILCISAMASEVKPLVKEYSPKTSKVKRGKVIEVSCNDKNIYFFITGVGRKNVLKNLKTIEHILDKVDIVVLVGVCGAIDERYKMGDVVIPEAITKRAGNEILIKNLDLLPWKDIKISKSVHKGVRLLTDDSFVTQEEKKDIRKKQYEISAVDMESFYGVSFFVEKQKPIYVIKSVSDRFNSPLPRESFLIEHYSKKSFIGMLKNFILHPQETYKLLLLLKNIKYAIKINTRYVKELLDRLLGVQT